MQHAVTRDEMRKHIHFIKELAKATDAYVQKNSDNALQVAVAARPVGSSTALPGPK